MERWIVVRTKSRRENWAAENVQRQGCMFYLPRYEVPPTRKIKEARAAVLFPCYLFVKIQNQWKFLLGTFGIQAVIMGGSGEPATMPQKEIDRLKQRENEGLIKLPTRLEKTDLPNVGDKVKITQGPFEGHFGLWMGQTNSERQRILLDFLGGKRETLFDIRALELANEILC